MFWIHGTFFPKIVWGAANKVSENKIPGKKVLKKINPRKRKPRIVNHAFSLVRGLFCIKSYWSQKKSPRK